MTTGWETAPIGRVLDRSRVTNEDRAARLLSLTISGSTVARGGDGGLGAQAPSEAAISKYLLVQPAQLVVNPMWLVGGSIGMASRAGAVSPAYRVYSVADSIEPRFLHHAVRSELSRSRYAMLARGETTFDRAVSADDFESLPFRWPSKVEQRRIADFLDDRVSRIDRIISAKQHQSSLATELAQSRAAALLDKPDRGSRAALSFLAKIVDTEHKTVPQSADGGHWSAWTGAIRNGSILEEYLREINSDAYSTWTQRGVPAAGDVLLTREAPVGEVALIAANHPKIAIGQRVVLLKPNPDSLDSKFLRLALMAGSLRQLIDRASTGSLHPHLNMADISRLPIPLLPLREQVSLGEEHTKILDDERATSRALARSLELLIEYKSSLITAAVTGELDVTTAGSNIPG